MGWFKRRCYQRCKQVSSVESNLSPKLLRSSVNLYCNLCLLTWWRSLNKQSYLQTRQPDQNLLSCFTQDSPKAEVRYAVPEQHRAAGSPTYLSSPHSLIKASASSIPLLRYSVILLYVSVFSLSTRCTFCTPFSIFNSERRKWHHAFYTQYWIYSQFICTSATTLSSARLNTVFSTLTSIFSIQLLLSNLHLSNTALTSFIILLLVLNHPHN